MYIKKSEIILLINNHIFRSTKHRIGLYKLLSSLDYHIIAIDYRGFGDSTGTPAEKDVVKDAQFIYEYIQQTVPDSFIYIWGHSLGAGIASHLGKLLNEKNIMPEGLILESPFFNIADEIESHPLAKVYFNYKFLITLISNYLKYV